MRLNFIEKLLSIILRKYTKKIYIKGIIDGFNWKEK